MKAFVINLPKDIARRESVERELSKIGLNDITYVDGVDVRSVSSEERSRLFDHEKFGYTHIGPCTPGEIGCVLAHRKVWKIIAELDEPTFVFEDDTRIADNDWSDIFGFVKEFLQSDKPRALSIPFYVSYYSYVNYGKIDIVRVHNAYGTPCYAINPKGAQLLLGLGKPYFVSDAWRLYRRSGLDVRAVVPCPLVCAGEEISSIGAHNYEKDWRSAAMIAQPGVYVYDYNNSFYELILYKLGILHAYDSYAESGRFR